MRRLNKRVMELLQDGHPRAYPAYEIVRLTGLSFSTVRNTLNLARGRGIVERDLDVGLNNHTLYCWYWRGGAS